jgi:ABC-type glycerol-3-phosphate transport system permease component
VLNYQRVLDEILLHGRAIFNTLILVILTVGGALLVNPLAAYALSRFKLRKTYHVLLFCLATIAFPAEVTMIPVFLQMKEFHLLNTFGALVLPTLASGFSIFLLKGFFDSLPKELYEAAELDGASEWTMFWQITMTLSKPILAVIALGAFTSAYGTFFYALILAPDPKMWTLMVYIFQLRSGVDYPVVYASLIITAIPTLLVFIFCQKIILRGIVVPSDK